MLNFIQAAKDNSGCHSGQLEAIQKQVEQVKQDMMNILQATNNKVEETNMKVQETVDVMHETNNKVDMIIDFLFRNNVVPSPPKAPASKVHCRAGSS